MRVYPVWGGQQWQGRVPQRVRALKGQVVTSLPARTEPHTLEGRQQSPETQYNIHGIQHLIKKKKKNLTSKKNIWLISRRKISQ